MTAAAARAALEQTILFGALDDATLGSLASRATVTRHARGAAVVVAGEPGGDVLIVASGRLKVLARSPDGVDIVLAVVGIGDTLGELSLLDRAPRSATVEAAEAAVVVRVSGDAVRETIRAHPDLAEELITQQAAMIRRATGMVSDLVFLDVPRRVAKYVAERTDHRGRAELAMSQSELAAAVGGVRQTVNAALRGLERRGWIRMDGRSVTVHNRTALEEYAAVGAP